MGNQIFFNFLDWNGKSEDKLQYIKKNDEIKNIYCKTNKIQLIRIPYTQINEISNILNKKVF